MKPKSELNFCFLVSPLKSCINLTPYKSTFFDIYSLSQKKRKIAYRSAVGLRDLHMIFIDLKKLLTSYPKKYFGGQ